MLRLIATIGLMGMLAVASSADAQMWSAVASTGTFEDTSLGTYWIGASSLAFRSGATGTVGAYFNVTNPTSGSPSWTTFEFTARNPGGSAATYAQAILYRVPRSSSSGASSVCIASAPATGATSTTTCTFSSSLIDFANYYYFVRVVLGRDSTASVVAAYEMRVF
jgi:hypothetical protein